MSQSPAPLTSLHWWIVRIVSQTKLFLSQSCFWLEYLSQQWKSTRKKSGTPNFVRLEVPTWHPRDWVWWCLPVISALGWKGQEKVILGYRVSLRTATAACDPDSKQNKDKKQTNTTPPDTQSKANNQREKENKSEERDVEEREGWNDGWLKSSHRRSPSWGLQEV